MNNLKSSNYVFMFYLLRILNEHSTMFSRFRTHCKFDRFIKFDSDVNGITKDFESKKKEKQLLGPKFLFVSYFYLLATTSKGDLN